MARWLERQIQSDLAAEERDGSHPARQLLSRAKSISTVGSDMRGSDTFSPIRPPAVHTVLRLQALAGNSAVSSWLSRALVLQRDDPVDPPKSFESLGYGLQTDAGKAETITRPIQVLSEYGMTCYGTSVMFILQSYGLIPPDMTRQEFEFAFTPLNPNATNPGDAKTGDIKVAGKPIPDTKPIDLVTKGLEGTARPSKRKTSIGKVTSTEATLRGAEKGSFAVADIMVHMPSILAAFRAQSEEKGYAFMKAHTPTSGHAYAANASGEKWIDCSTELIAGTIGADYFKDGNTIMTGVDYEYPPGPSLGHWVVIAKEAEKREIAGRQYFLYPADDPLWSKAYVMAPMLGKLSDKALSDAHLSKEGDHLTYNGARVHMLYKGQAYRRKQKKIP